MKASYSEFSEIDSDERRKKRLLKNNLAEKAYGLMSEESVYLTPRDEDIINVSPSKKV